MTPLFPSAQLPPVAERRYALTKVAAGDWLLPSNDGQTIWRLKTYEDGPSNGLLDWPRDRELWGVWKWLGGGEFVDVEDWDRWTMVEGYCETRGEAIKAAMRL